MTIVSEIARYDGEFTEVIQFGSAEESPRAENQWNAGVWFTPEDSEEIDGGTRECARPGCHRQFVPERANQGRCPKHRGKDNPKRPEIQCRGCKTYFVPAVVRKYLPEICEDCARPPYYKVFGGFRRFDSYDTLVQFMERLEYRFAAIDGEGTGTGDQHKYVMLTLGTDEPLINEAGIKIGDAFRYLYDRYDSHAVYVSFYFAYDLSQLLSQIPWDRASMVFTAEGVKTRRREYAPGRPIPHATPRPAEFTDHRGQRWQFDVLEGRMKRIKFRPRNCDCMVTKTGKTFADSECRHMKKVPWFYICDVNEFFSTSLLDIVESDGAVATPDELRILREGKAARGTAGLDDAMILYNRTENVVLAKIMDRVKQALAVVNVWLAKDEWIGLGQAAQRWMDAQPDILTREKFLKENKTFTPDVAAGGIASYYGGITENIAHGIVPGTTWAYDRRSAYCADMADLPCLYHARFQVRRTKPRDLEPGQLLIEHATVTAPLDPVPSTGPLPYREKTGLSHRPLQLSGWYWSDEIMAARDAGLVRAWKSDRYLLITPQCDHRPFERITDFYGWRNFCRPGSIEAGLFKKLPSSVYGKLAQSAGEPKYGNPFYASLITSRNRVAVLKACARAGTDDVFMIIVDSVYTRNRHPELVSDELGGWKETRHENLTIVQPQLYYDDQQRADAKMGINPHMKARGVRKQDDRAQIIAQCDDEFGNWTPDTCESAKWPVITFMSDFDVITPPEAVKMKNWSKCGLVRNGMPYKLATHPGRKRDTELGAFRWSETLRAYVSKPYLRGESGLESEPYRKEFGYIPSELEIDSLGNTPDGPRAMTIREMMR